MNTWIKHMGARIILHMNGEHTPIGVPILMYHRVCPPSLLLSKEVHSATPRAFEQQMRFLKQNYSVISLHELISYLHQYNTTPKNAAVITFDDGYEDNYTYAFPILVKYHLPATIFLCQNFVEKHNPFWWDRLSLLHKNKLIPRLKYMHPLDRDNLIMVMEKGKKKCPAPAVLPSQIYHMINFGVTFGAHTLTHPILSKLSETEAHNEIYSSVQWISQVTGQAVPFCYPNGQHEDYNENTKEMVQASGSYCAVSTNYGFVDASSDLFALPRIGISPEDTLTIFRAKLSGHKIVARAFNARPKRLVQGVKHYHE